MTAPVRVLLVDDHPIVRSGLRAVLEADPGVTVVGEAATGAEAVARAVEAAPDVVLMDLQLGPGIDGIEA
ncbi:MAG TPA: response regulator transcription factor, partial [Micromonosporaceae bacterium]